MAEARLAAAPAVKTFGVAALGQLEKQIYQFRLQIKTLALFSAGIEALFFKFGEIHSKTVRRGHLPAEVRRHRLRALRSDRIQREEQYQSLCRKPAFRA